MSDDEDEVFFTASLIADVSLLFTVSSSFEYWYAKFSLSLNTTPTVTQQAIPRTNAIII